MIDDEEERKRRLEEARNIISNTSNLRANTSNNNLYNQRLQEANSIINSINPSKTREITEEERQNSINNANSFMNLLDKNSTSEVTPSEMIITDTNSSDILKISDELEKEKDEKTVKELKATANVVTAQNNNDGNNAISNFRAVQNSNTVLNAENSEEDKSLWDIIVDEFKREVDTIAGIGGNFVLGATDTFTAPANWIQAFETWGEKTATEQLLKLVGYSDEDAKKAGEIVEKNSKNSIYSKLNTLYTNNPEVKQWKNNTIQENIEKASSNPVTKYLAELAPSIGSNLVPMAISAVNPVLGSALFMLQAGGSYLDDAKARGMSDDEALGYATIMGILEGGSEAVITGSMVSKIGKALIGKGLSKEVLNSWGVNILENFAQEALMEPSSELTAEIFGGPDAADWDNMGIRMLQAGISGIVSSIILGGASVGIASSQKILNETNLTTDDYAQAVIDTINSGEVDVDGIVNGVQQAIITNGGTQQFYTTTFNQDGNVENVQAVRGKEIDNPNSKVNVTPIIVKNQDNSYDVIDATTGILLDSSRYRTLIEAQTEFNSKMINLDNASINNINNKIAQATIAIDNKINEVASNIGNENVTNTSQSGTENVINDTQTGTNNVMNGTNSGINNTSVDTNTNTSTNTLNNSNMNTDTYQTSQNQFTDNYSNETTNYSSNSTNASTSQNNALNDVTRLLSQISDNSIYSRQQTRAIIENISRNIPTVEIQQVDNTTYINSLDREGNVVRQQQITNRPYTGGEIRDLVNNAVYNADLSEINITQANENEFRDVSDVNVIKYSSKNENENVGKNKTTKNNIIDNLMQQIIETEKDNFESNIEIDTKVVDETSSIPLNYSKAGQSTLSNIAKKLFNALGKKSLHNKSEKIYVTNSDINESIAQTLKNPSQKILLKENLSVFSQLDKIVENAKEIENSNTSISDNKGRTQYSNYKYYYTHAYIDGEKSWIQFDTRVQKGTTGQEERHFRLERIYKINEADSNGGTDNSITHFSNESTSINTSISQNNQSVKNNTTVNNKSMQKDKNNTSRREKNSKNQNVKDNGIRAERTSNNKQNKTLIAQHNTSEEKLLEALDLGALPVPSIAITKYQNPVLKYGDITLLFNKDTINPTDKRNVTYNSDIYSSRKPEIGIALDKQKLKSFEKTATEKGIGYGYLGMIEEYIEQNEFSRARELIQHELEKNNNTINMQDVEDIYSKLLESIQEKRIMKPDVDPYTSSGNRKTIIQRSIPYTLDNIVRIMTQKSIKGSESNSFAGLAEIRANLAQNFKSIEAMHQNENSLITNEEMENLKQELNDKFYALVDEIAKYDKVNRYLGSTEVVANALNETAKAKNLNTATLDNELDYVDIRNVPEKTLQKAIDFLNSMRNIPTEYFEAKPQRAVSFDEVKKAIVPRNTSKKIVDKLKSKGIPIEYYSNSEQRQKLISNDKDIRFENINNSNTANQQYNSRSYEENEDFMRYLNENEYLKNLMEVDEKQGETYAHNAGRLIEQEIRKLEQTNGFDNSIPVTKLTDIDREIENYLGRTIGKGHFRDRARGIYNKNIDRIRVKEYKDLDNVFHELGHALDLGGRITVDKASLSDELLAAVRRHGGYENESIGVQLDEGFAEILKTYAINKDIVKQDYPKSYKVLEDFKASNVEFGNFITKLQEDTYNYIHQSPRNRGLSNQSIGEQTDKETITIEKIAHKAVKTAYDSNYEVKRMQEEFSKATGHKPTPSQNAYLLTRLASGVDNKIVSMLTNGYVDENGNRLMPGLGRIGEILGNDPERINDLRAYLAARRDLEYKAKTLKTGLRTMDSKTIIEQFYNDAQIQEAAQVVYDTLDGVLQYAVDNGLITEENAKSLRESNVFYVPFQRVIEGRGNQVGRRGAVSDIIKQRTGSELDIKDVLENIVTNSANIIKQVENNNILRAVYEQGEETGMKNNVFDVIPAPMRKIGTEQLSTWEAELKRQGIDTSELDLDKTIDLFAPNNNIVTEKDGSHIVSFLDKNGKRKYLQFYKDSTDIFNSLMGLDKNANSTFLKIMRSANMPLRYGATMANVGFAIPNMISDTVQASIFSEAGFIPVVDNVLGVLDVLGATNKTVRNFLNQVAPEYAQRINNLYDIYQQTGATSSMRMAQYRKSAQEIMRDIYGTKNSESLGIKESFKPLKRLMDILTYIPELSESSTRFRVFERNYDAYINKGMSETDARIQAAIESRDATQDFGRTGTLMREVNQLIPFSAARVGSAYTFAERAKANPGRTAARVAILLAVTMAIKAIGYDDDEIEELNQRKKDDNFVLKIGDTVITIKKPQGILRSIVNLTEYIQDLATGHIEDGKEGERLVEWATNAIMDNMPADSVTGLVPNAIAPVVENAINKDFYYNTDIVKSYDLDLPDAQQYYDYTSQLAIWLGQIFNYSPAKIDNLISGYFGGLGTQVTDIIDWVSAKLGLSAEEPDMGAEDNAVGKRFVVNVNENSASVDEIYEREEELTKKLNGGTITGQENEELENIKAGISKLSALNKQIKAIKQDLTMSGTEKADAIRPLQEQKVDVARQALGKDTIYTDNADELEALEFYPSRSTLSYNGLTLNLTEEMKSEYMDRAYELYNQYLNQGIYSEEYLEKLKDKVKDAAKKEMIQKYKNQLVK